MHSECFFASIGTDTVAKALISITRDFVIGTGYEVQCDMTDSPVKWPWQFGKPLKR